MFGLISLIIWVAVIVVLVVLGIKAYRWVKAKLDELQKTIDETKKKVGVA